jgi:hypothetical protein
MGRIALYSDDHAPTPVFETTVSSGTSVICWHDPFRARAARSLNISRACLHRLLRAGEEDSIAETHASKLEAM